MKTNHFSKPLFKGIVHPWKATRLSPKLTFDFNRETKMEIMIILTIGLLALVAVNEVTDH